MPPIQIPAGIPVAYQNLIQQNFLGAKMADSLSSYASYRADAAPSLLPPGIGETITSSRLSMFNVDTLPVAPTGAIPLGEFSSEQWSAKPIPYALGFRLDGPTAYVSRENLHMTGMTRLFDWAARTTQRVHRGKLFAAYCSANGAMIRRAQTTSDSTLLVNSGAAFRYVWVNGIATPVSGTNSLAITIVAATTFAATVIGVTPLDPRFPNGPAELTLSAPLSAAVAAASYVYPTAQRVPVVRAGDRASSDALTSTDFATLANIRAMRRRLIGLGVGPHADGTHHLHHDETLLPALQRDAQFNTAFQGAGIVPFLGSKALRVEALGITFIENNDSPANGRGNQVIVGAADFSGVGGTGTPGANTTSMQDIGLDLVNASGVPIARAIMTGADVTEEVYIDEELYFSQLGIQKLGEFTPGGLAVYGAGAMQFVSGAVDRWRLNIVPALDDRGISCKFSVSYPFDVSVPTDYRADSNTSDLAPWKRASVLEYSGA